jgi:spermidine/putrescine transport system permease protein
MNRRLVALVAGIGLLAMHLPLLVLMAWSFNASRTGARWDGFTLGWYTRLVERPDLLRALWTSLVVGSISTLLATLLGTGAALALARGRFRGRAVLEAMLAVPIVTPEIVAGISLLILVTGLGVPLGLLTVIIAHTTFSLPFTTLVILARLRGMDTALEDAALTLGADEWTAFRRVTLPLLMPGVIGAALLAFTLSFDDYVITFFTAGPGTTTLPLMVYSMVRRTVEPSVNAISTLLVMGTTVILIIAASAVDVSPRRRRSRRG